MRAVRQGQVQTTAGRLIYLEFWGGFVQYLAEAKLPIRQRKPQPQHWYDVAIGKSGVHVSLTVRLRDEDIGTELYIGTTEAKRIFLELQRDRTVIEGDLGAHADWLELPEGKASRIVVRNRIPIADRERWPEAFEWFGRMAQKFREVFAPRVRRLLEAADGSAERNGD